MNYSYYYHHSNILIVSILYLPAAQVLELHESWERWELLVVCVSLCFLSSYPLLWPYSQFQNCVSFTFPNTVLYIVISSYFPNFISLTCHEMKTAASYKWKHNHQKQFFSKCIRHHYIFSMWLFRHVGDQSVMWKSFATLLWMKAIEYIIEPYINIESLARMEFWFVINKYKMFSAIWYFLTAGNYISWEYRNNGLIWKQNL